MIPDNWVAVGIDPGASGAVAFIDSHGNYEAWVIDTKDLSVVRDCMVDASAARGAGYAVTVGLEKVSGRGGWGSKQVFSFGGSWWVPNAHLLDEGYDIQHIVPVRWQREILGAGVSAPRDKVKRKKLWITKAQKKWPDLILKSGHADALWLAHTAAVIRGWVC